MNNSTTKYAVQTKMLTKSYQLGRVTLDVLRGVDFGIKRGEFVAITGASGSGKSTLLHLIGLLDTPSSGEIHIEGIDAARISSHARNTIRMRDIGFVFQFYHLLGELNVIENVTLAAKVGTSVLGWPARRKEAIQRATSLLLRVGLGDRMKHRPNELSGGERQRVSIARALMNQPRLLLADEPTGNLDSKTGSKILDLLHRCNEEDGQTIVMVTHDITLAHESTRAVVLKDGLVVG